MKIRRVTPIEMMRYTVVQATARFGRRCASRSLPHTGTMVQFSIDTLPECNSFAARSCTSPPSAARRPRRGRPARAAAAAAPPTEAAAAARADAAAQRAAAHAAATLRRGRRPVGRPAADAGADGGARRGEWAVRAAAAALAVAAAGAAGTHPTVARRRRTRKFGAFVSHMKAEASMGASSGRARGAAGQRVTSTPTTCAIWVTSSTTCATPEPSCSCSRSRC